MTSHRLLEESVQCPYCWERFTILVDASVESQDYIEDCEVCCRPIDFSVEVGEQDQVNIITRHADE